MAKVELLQYLTMRDFITEVDLCDYVGFNRDRVIERRNKWICVKYNDVELRFPQKPILSNVSWVDLDNRGLVYGERILVLEGVSYNIRLFEGLTPGPVTPESLLSLRGTCGSEWNTLLYPFYKPSEDQYILGDDLGSLAQFTDLDLLTHIDICTASRSWVQESRNSDSNLGTLRGGWGLDYVSQAPKSTADATMVWRPILERITE